MRACSLPLCYQQQQQTSMATVPLTWSLGRGGVGDTRMMDMYSEYADTATADESPSKIKARLSALSVFAGSQGLTGQAAFDGLRSLCSQLQAELLDTRNFALFYHFVFFMCRERGQKSISVSTAVNGWRLALTGRFRLLDQWCAFVQVHQRHAISEDTWRQVLEFSRSVHEDLSNYDPEGAWPVLVDEFVDSMYRKNACSRCSKDTHRVCDCGVDAMPMLNTDDSSLNCRASALPGMAAQAGSKRRWKDPVEEAAQAESVNCLSQRLAKMPSPVITKRMRTSGAEAATVAAAAAAAASSDPMEDELQEAQGITVWEHHRDRASHVSNHPFAQASMLGQDLRSTSGNDAPSWQSWPSHQGNRRWGQIHGSNSHVLLPNPDSTPSSACGGYPAFLSPQQDLLLHQ